MNAAAQENVVVIKASRTDTPSWPKDLVVVYYMQTPQAAAAMRRG